MIGDFCTVFSASARLSPIANLRISVLYAAGVKKEKEQSHSQSVNNFVVETVFQFALRKVRSKISYSVLAALAQYEFAFLRSKPGI